MDACTFESVEELAAALAEVNARSIRITHPLAADIAPVIMERARRYAAQGAPVLIVCVDDTAVARHRALLAEDAQLSPIDIVTMDELACRLLALPGVAEAAGRGSRVLTLNEIDVLMEDMKVTGNKPRRLREMLRFFYRCFAEYADERPGWIFTPEEKEVFHVLERNLAARESVLPWEVAGVAYRGIGESGIALEPLNVLAVDFGAFSKAEQRLVERIATADLVVSGVDGASVSADEDYPCAEGFAAFCDERAGSIDLALRPTLADRICETAVFDTPVDEFSQVARMIDERIGEGVAPEQILLGVPNTVWADHMANALAERGVRAFAMERAGKVKGDPRDADRCALLAALTALKLIDDGKDLPALRSWIGFGDYLLCSDSFKALMDHCEADGKSMLEALGEVAACEPGQTLPFPYAFKFDLPLQALSHIRALCGGKKGAELVDALAESGVFVPERMRECARNLGEAGTPAALLAEMLRVPGYADAPVGAVIIAPYALCHGIHVNEVFVTGMVNGFLPHIDALDDDHSVDHHRLALERDRALLADVEACASRRVHRTLFERDLYDNAHALHMDIARIYCDDGRDIAKIAPSELIA